MQYIWCFLLTTFPNYLLTSVITDNFSFIHIISKEVHGIAPKSVPINVIIYYPTTEKGNKELANRVGYVHADLIQQFIQKLNYSPNQKVQLIDNIINSISIEKAANKST